MGIKGAITSLFSSGIGEVFKTTFEGVDNLITSKEEEGAQEIKLTEVKLLIQESKQNFKLANKQLELDLAEQEIRDRESARQMYMKDSSLQKIFSLVFLSGYVVLSIAMISIIFGLFGIGPAIALDAFQASIISMVFTAMSTKVNTITDFLFGGSKSNDDSEKRIADTFNNASQ